MNTAKLIEWFEAHRRPLPWRDQGGAYAVWISEVMSQQTTLAAVVPYFNRWMKTFSSVEKLARAPESRVLAAWAGLGYYSRARNIHKTAKLIAKQGFPKTASEWLQMPGVGPYTSRAIGAIALGEAVLPVDGNVIRVLSRQLNVREPYQSKKHMSRVQQAALDWAQTTKIGQHQALAEGLMELGATICRPGALAKCGLCPIAATCLALQKNQVDQVPQPKTRAQVIERSGFLVAYRNPKSPRAFLVKPVKDEGRLQGQFELPRLKKLKPGLPVLGRIRHSITKHRDTFWVLDGGFWRRPLPQGHFWTESKQVHVSTTTRKALTLIFNVDSGVKLGKPT